MRKLFWSRTWVALIFSLIILVWIFPAISAEQDSEDSAGRKETQIPDGFEVTITGRILSQEKEPLVGISILVSETDKEKVGITLQVRNGKVVNPTGKTDNSGRFTIVADRRFWETTGHFTLDGGIIPGTMQSIGFLRGSNNEQVIIKIDAKTKNVDLGDIIVSRQ